MTTPILSLITSSLVLLVILCVFHVEEKRGYRFFPSARAHLDFWLLKIRHTCNMRLRAWGRYFIRQIIHYFVHTFLTGALASLGALEETLRTMARSNRALAKKSDKERTHMNKLEEIALHKLEVALTEEEKRIRKRQSIEGEML